MILTANSQNNFEEEKQFLRDVFEQESRGNEFFYIYNYDQRYYKVLSACAKLKLRTRNLPEGNPHYIEINGHDWNQVMEKNQATQTKQEQKPADPAKTVTSAERSNIVSLEPRDQSDKKEPAVEQAVFSLYDEDATEEKYDPFGSLKRDETEQKPSQRFVKPTPEPEDLEPDIESAIEDLVSHQQAEQPAQHKPDQYYKDDAKPMHTNKDYKPQAEINQSPFATKSVIMNESPETTEFPKENNKQDYDNDISSEELSVFQGGGKRLEALRQREKAVQIREQAVVLREQELDAEEQKVLQRQKTIQHDKQRLDTQREQIETLREKVYAEQNKLKQAKESIEKLSKIVSETLAVIG